MTPIGVLKMLKNKIDSAGLNKCNYAIETSDIEAINQALLLYDVSNTKRTGCTYGDLCKSKDGYGNICMDNDINCIYAVQSDC